MSYKKSTLLSLTFITALMYLQIPNTCAKEVSQHQTRTQDTREYITNYREAIKGDGDAQYRVGMALMYGQGVSENRVEGMKWLTRSAEQGNSYAMFKLMELYDDDLLIPRDTEKAILWAQRIERDGLGDREKATQFLAVTWSNSRLLPELNQSIDRFIQFITEDNAQYFEQYRLGMAYLNRSTFNPEDKTLAIKWLNISAKNSPAGFKRFPLLALALHLNENESAQELEYTQQMTLAQKGNGEAQLAVANYLYSTNQVTLGMMWLEKAAAQNIPNALFRLGKIHIGVSDCISNILDERYPGLSTSAVHQVKEEGEEEYWFQNSCGATGLTQAQVKLMNLNQLKEISRTSLEKGYPLIQKAADLNHPEALYETWQHNGSHEEPQKAFARLLKAGELGEVRAASSLGEAYLKGIGVEKNLKESLRWYEKTAEDGIEAGAAFNVAQFYCKGMGIPFNKDYCKYYLKQGQESVGEDQVDRSVQNLGLMPYVKKYLKSPSQNKSPHQ